MADNISKIVYQPLAQQEAERHEHFLEQLRNLEGPNVPPSWKS